MPSLSDLLRMGKQYISDALPGGSLNPEMQPIADRAKYIAGGIGEDSPMNRDLQSWHGKTQRGLSDLLAGNEGPQADYGYAQMMNMAGVAPVGMTAWHGSPHKFDKFSLDKIGTGEGAQAYGHGLYLAESPGVASGYRDKLAKNEVLLDGLKVKHDRSLMDPQSMGLNALQMEPSPKSAADALRKAVADDSLWGRGSQYDQRANYSAAADWLEQNAKRIQVDSGHLYKTDIPDEAVARFLDWDKPLSQQAPEVQKMLEPLGYSSKAQVGAHDDALLAALTGDATTALPKIRDPMGSDIARGGGVFDGPGQVAKSEMLRKLGIPGIRYLDGGSRSAGQGSSNFVVFDPEMIRILERNGVPTGQKPWNPNEYRPLSDLMNPRID